MSRVVPSQVVSMIDRLYPSAKNNTLDSLESSQKGRLNAILRLVDELPDDLVTLSGEDYNKFVHSVEGVRTTVGIWNAGQKTDVNDDRRTAINLLELRECLVLLPDQQVPAATAGLKFIKDRKLRNSIREDVAYATQAFRDGEWKGATILAGAAIEALLLWAIKRHTPRTAVTATHSNLVATRQIPPTTAPNPDNWTLEIYKKVAESLGIIRPDTVKVVDVAQRFRNLIHPGKAIRTNQSCSKGTAHTALGALESVIEDLMR